jgi:hypothetical protein
MTRSFFSIPRKYDPDPGLLFKGLNITSREDICTEHMGKYPVIFCDFKVRVFSLQTVQTTRLYVAESHWPVLGGNALEIQGLSFRTLQEVERLSHAVS